MVQLLYYLYSYDDPRLAVPHSAQVLARSRPGRGGDLQLPSRAAAARKRQVSITVYISAQPSGEAAVARRTPAEGAPFGWFPVSSAWEIRDPGPAEHG